MIQSIKHKGLKAFASHGTTTGINPSHAKKLRKLLRTLQQARHLGELSNGLMSTTIDIVFVNAKSLGQQSL